MTYAYDDNGNTLTKTDAAGLTQYGWDYVNRLTSVTLPGGPVVTFKYDPFGRRIQKASPAGVSNYVYDGANITEEVDAAGAVQARYAQGLGIDEPVAMQRGGNLDFFAADRLGSVTSLTDASGTIGTELHLRILWRPAEHDGNAGESGAVHGAGVRRRDRDVLLSRQILFTRDWEVCHRRSN